MQSAIKRAGAGLLHHSVLLGQQEIENDESGEQLAPSVQRALEVSVRGRCYNAVIDGCWTISGQIRCLGVL